MSSTAHMHGGIGESIKRKEDGRFLRGKGNYLDDFVLPNMMHMAILRSPYAHARIISIDVESAREVPGVVAVLTAKDLPTYGRAINSRGSAVLATDRALFRGHPIAVIVAESEAAARL